MGLMMTMMRIRIMMTIITLTMLLLMILMTMLEVSSRSRIRCYSEVTSTPYSSHENLSSVTCPSLGEDTFDTCPDIPASSSMSPGHSPCAEAPELSSFLGEMDGEIPLGVNLHRRNSAPEINESLPFNDESS